jgi:hypothetical protein
VTLHRAGGEADRPVEARVGRPLLRGRLSHSDILSLTLRCSSLLKHIHLEVWITLHQLAIELFYKSLLQRYPGVSDVKRENEACKKESLEAFSAQISKGRQVHYQMEDRKSEADNHKAAKQFLKTARRIRRHDSFKESFFRRRKL